MAIAPPSDIVLDVLQAANPATQASRTAKFSRMSGLSPTAGATATLPFDAVSAAIARRNQGILVQPASAPVRTPYKQFESVILQNFVSSVLPQSDNQMFGKGTSGSVARSWMSDAIAGQLSDAGGIGIANLVSANYTQPTAETNRPHNIESVVQQSDHLSQTSSSPIAQLFTALGSFLFNMFHHEAKAGGAEQVIKLSR